MKIIGQSRQAVCETTAFFRSYHSGVYHCKGEVEGYLLGGFSSEYGFVVLRLEQKLTENTPCRRDQFAHSGKLIISHG